MTPLGLGNYLLHTFWTLGLRAAQKVCTKLPREAPGTPNGPPKVPKGAQNGEPKLEHSVKNNIKRLKEKTKKQQPKNRRKYKGKPSQPELAGPACPIQPCQHRQPGPASQPSQHSTVNTSQPTSLRVGAGGRGRSP